MLIKAYIKNHMFHLPMEQEALLEQVEKALKRNIDKSNISKLYPLTKIEDNENILVEKQHTNIFLLNLLLLVLNSKDIDIVVQEYFNDTFIISELENVTQLNFKSLPFEVIEKEVINYLNPNSENLMIDVPQIELRGIENTEDKKSCFENIQFSVNWIKEAQKELNRRE